MKKIIKYLLFLSILISACQKTEVRETNYDNGQIKEQFHVKKGKNDAYIKTGEYLFYYENGQIAEKGNYKNDQLNGAYQRWFESGKLKSKFNFKDDKIHGEYNEYNEDGELLITSEYKGGNSQGKCTIFSNEKKEIVGQYNEGFADGKWQLFENGDLLLGEVELNKGSYTQQASTAKTIDIANAENVSFLGFEINKTTYADVKLGFLDRGGLIPKSYIEPHPKSGGKVIITTGKEVGVAPIKDIYFVFDPDYKLIAIQYILPKRQATTHNAGFRAGFNSMYELLSPDYQLVSKEIPFVGNTYAKFKRNNSYILVDAPHLSHDLTVSYWLSGYENVVI